MKRYWDPAPGRPGLASVQGRLPQTTGDEILGVLTGTVVAQTRLLTLVDPVVVNKGERARFLVDELESVIEFVLDDDVQEDADEKLAKIQAFHAQEGQRSSALAQSLSDYAALATELQSRLVANDSGFDVGFIAEAIALAAELRAAPAQVAADPGQVATATRVRNGFLGLLASKVHNVRRVARHVFRRQPEIVREATSAYERRRRAAARRAKTPKEEGGAAAQKQ